jgi:3'-phosphoadenosine 5'-phosphosulfate sulfotransferase (PAPS reductase)/FAD synthetase
VCAVCESVVAVESWPYEPEYLKAVYMTRTKEREKRAREVIRKHITENAAVALSGKDSMAALHLTATTETDVDIDVVIAAYVAVRRLPQKVVDELRAFAESLGVRRVIIHDEPWDVHASLFAIISRTYGYNVLITGLRRRENRGHFSAVEYIRVDGRTVRLINPLIDWSAAEVWSYIYNYRLPVLTPYRHARPDTPLQHLV